MKKLLLLSNGLLLRQNGSVDYAWDYLAAHFQASPQTPKTILFVPYAGKDYDACTNFIASALQPFGINVVSPHMVDNPIALLDHVDGVFIGGGNTFRLLDTLQKTGLLEAIKAKVEAGMPYAGASAGSNVACPTIQTSNDMPIVQPLSLNAMNLVPFQVNPHYVDGKFYCEENGTLIPHNGESRSQRITEFQEENSTPVVGLKEGSALYVEGNRVTLLGKCATLFLQGAAPMEIRDGNVLSVLMSRQPLLTSSFQGMVASM